MAMLGKFIGAWAISILTGALSYGMISNHADNYAVLLVIVVSLLVTAVICISALSHRR